MCLPWSHGDMNIHTSDRSRLSLRLIGYDYGQPGAYFVTVCTQGRECLFGDVADGEMQPNDAGRMVTKWWLELARKFPSVSVEYYVVMPNHVHGIIDIDSKTACMTDQGAHVGAPLPKIIQWFKTMTPNEYIRGVKNGAFPPFAGKIWQRNYYERIIRNAKELDSARLYISQNPAKWHLDRENPSFR